MQTQIEELQCRIESAVAGSLPRSTERNRKLAAVKWRMRGIDGQFVGLAPDLVCDFVPEASAQVFDGRDNEASKLAFYGAALGPLMIELL